MAVVAAAVCAAAACKDKPESHDLTSDNPTPRETATGAPLTDPGIVVLMGHIHGSEISAAQAALQRLQSADVRTYATAMIAEHQASRQQLQAVPVKAESAMVPPPQVSTLGAISKSESQLLTLMPSGPAYDRLYMVIQVADHSTALDSIRAWRALAKDGALKSYLMSADGQVQAHLARAQAIFSHLGGGTATGPVPMPPPDTAWYKNGNPATVDSMRKAQGVRSSGAPPSEPPRPKPAPPPPPKP
jgi:predicted outer membrane protein